ncbi:MAG: NAD(P)/FAD-dependent oxidoreductase [Lachnospiraceae bacterium]
MKQKNIIIIGGGASGIAAAITAGRMGAAVTILEQKEMLGKKILSTGNGKCNFTNMLMDASCFRGEHPEAVSYALLQFGVASTLQFFGSLGVIAKEKNGYVYPRTGQASTILDALVMEVKKLGVKICLNTTVSAAQKKNGQFQVDTNQGRFISDALILSTGGKAAKVLGSDGTGYPLAKSFGHTISPVVPALVQLKSEEPYFKKIAGVRADAKVTALVEGKEEASDTGELQLTKQGLSGIPIFQISRYLSKALQEKKKAMVEIDFLPHFTDESFYAFLEERLLIHGTKSAHEFLVGIFHEKLIDLFLQQAHILSNKRSNTFTKTELEKLVRGCKHFQVPITETNGFDHAQVCAGGVRTEEICEHRMESKYVEELFLTGELLDIDGICGGYNLQWAWSTGCLAGIYAGTKEKKHD